MRFRAPASRRRCARAVSALSLLGALILPSTGAAPPPPITALADFEIWAAGFGDVRGIAVDRAGAVFVADHHRGTIVRIAPDRTQRVVATRLDRPLGLALDATERLVVAEEGSGRILRLEPAGTWTVLATDLKQPRWVAVAADGTVFVTARRFTRRVPVDPDDDDEEPQVVVAVRPNGARVFADAFRRVEGITVGDGVVYVATRGLRDGQRSEGIVMRIPIRADGTAGPIVSVGASDRYKLPAGLARDPLGTVWLATPELSLGVRSHDVIAKLRPDGTLTRFAYGLDDPQGLAFDAAGNLFATDGHRGRIIRFHAPAPPVLDVAPFTNEVRYAVRGRGEPRSGVDIFVDAAPTATTGTTDATGAFTIATSLSPDRSNALIVYLTTHAGDGLTSAPAQAAIVHDGIAPTLSFVAPAAAAFVRGVQSVDVRGTDAGSGLAQMSLSVGPRALPAAITPALPATAATATARWDTTTLTDGAYDLRASASDRAGNALTISRGVIVDNTAPETTITEGPTGDISVTDARFVVAGTDALTPTARLQFAWRLDGGPWSAFLPLSESVVLSRLAEGPHTFEAKARDLAGNEDPTPARRGFAVRSLRVLVTEPLPNAVLDPGSVVVRGDVEGSPGAAVTVNGFAAMVEGTTFVAAVPIDVSTRTLTAVATSRAGASANASIPVSVSPRGSAYLSATPAIGIAPLQVTFELAGVRGDVTVEWDFDGDGVTDRVGPATDAQTFVYSTVGVRVARARFTDRDGRPRELRVVVQALDRSAFEAAARITWASMKDALRQGDIPRAVSFITADARDRYQEAFRLLSRRLPGIDSILADIRLVKVMGDIAFFKAVRSDGGRMLSFEVRFMIDSDGHWRIESF